MGKGKRAHTSPNKETHTWPPYAQHHPFPVGDDACPEAIRKWNNARRSYENRQRNIEKDPTTFREKERKAGALRMQKSRKIRKITKRMLMMMKVPVVGKDYFSEHSKKFSDPTGVGSTLPKSVLDILWAMKLGQKKKTNEDDDEDDDDDTVTVGEDESKPMAVASPESHLQIGQKECYNDKTNTGDDTGEDDGKLPAVMSHGSPSLVRKFNELHAFLPAPDAHTSATPCVMLFLLKQLITFMEEEKDMLLNEHYGIVSTLDTSDYSGIRQINAKRIEIFFNDDTGRSHACIETMILKMLQAYTNQKCSKIGIADHIFVRQCILEYCNALAKQDTRIADAAIPYEFKNHAIIATFDEADPQDIHIDLDTSDQYQFGVILTENAKPTWEYKATTPVLAKGASLSTIWHDIPDELDKKLTGNQHVRSKLDSYGCLLSDPKRVYMGGDFVTDTVSASTNDAALEESFPVGTIVSLPGMVPHGGPSSEKFRAVLFFTGNPKGAEGYDSNQQANRTMLISDWMVHVWIIMNKKERVYLLQKWYTEGLTKDKHAIANLGHNQLKQLALWLTATENERLRSQLIEHFASYRWTKEEWDTGKGVKYRFPHQVRLAIQQEEEEQVEKQKATIAKRKKKRKRDNQTETMAAV